MFESLLRGFIGIAFLILFAVLFSTNRKKINWRLVISGLALQVVFAFLVLRVPFVRAGFEGIGIFFNEIINFTNEGSNFLFRSFTTGKIEDGMLNFAFNILPTIVFFSALTSILYYYGVLQKIVYGFAWVMYKTMRLSGSESLAAAANIFIGQTEAPLVVKPYLKTMTKSEIMCLMTGGMATIAGGVLAAYMGFLGGQDEQMRIYFATHLLTASIMSAPAAIVAAKILMPQTEEEKVRQDMSISKEKLGTNALEAISNGTTEGLKLAVNVGAMLLVFIALIAMVNFFFTDMIGEWTGWNEKVAAATEGRYEALSLQYIFGIVFSPIAWLLGVPRDDIMVIGQLLGEKTIINEFIAYASLGELKSANLIMHEKSIIIATYALCGFANFSSIGIQIGGIGSLAPSQRPTLSQLGIRSLVGGTIACFLTASIAGMIIGA